MQGKFDDSPEYYIDCEHTGTARIMVHLRFKMLKDKLNVSI